MRLILAKLIWNFDMSLEEESKGWTNQKARFVWLKGPLMVKLRPMKRTQTAKAGQAPKNES
jgi:hypothetical protein